MSDSEFVRFRRHLHKDLLYLTLYRAQRLCGGDENRTRRARASQRLNLWQYYWCVTVDSTTEFLAIFEKRPQFCPILVQSRRMML